jgi:hypothetical protein
MKARAGTEMGPMRLPHGTNEVTRICYTESLPYDVDTLFIDGHWLDGAGQCWALGLRPSMGIYADGGIGRHGVGGPDTLVMRGYRCRMLWRWFMKPAKLS